MTLQTFVYIGIWLIAIIFSAGVGWGAATVQNRRTRKDVNGLGMKMNGVVDKINAIERDARDRYLTQTVAIMSVANAAEDKTLTVHVGDILNDPARGK